MIVTVNLRTDHTPKYDSATPIPASTGETHTHTHTQTHTVIESNWIKSIQ